MVKIGFNFDDGGWIGGDVTSGSIETSFLRFVARGGYEYAAGFDIDEGAWCIIQVDPPRQDDDPKYDWGQIDE